MPRQRVELVLRVPESSLKGSVFITGFPGFGRVGYVVPKYISTSMSLSKAGFFVTPRLPSVIVMEDDGVGFPFEIYYGRAGGRALTVMVNRAVPDPAEQGVFCSELARWVADTGFEFVVLVGGLSREYEPPNEQYGYRWLHNSHYKGPRLRAPLMPSGLGVIGPLALLHIYLEQYGVPSVMVLPFSVVEDVDYDAALVGVRTVLGELLGLQVETSELERLAAKQKEEMEKIAEILAQGRRPERGGTNIYM